MDDQRRGKKEDRSLRDVVLEAYAEDPLDSKAYQRVNMEAASRRANAGIQDPQSESILFRTRCQKTEFGTYGDVGNGRRRKEEGTSKIEMNRWDSRGHRHECLLDG